MRLIVLLASLLLPSTAFADAFRFDLREQLLNKLADEIGTITYSGTHTVRGPDYPCLRCTDYYAGFCVAWTPATCDGPVIFSAGWTASVSNVDLQISTAGINFSADLSANYGGLPYSTPVTGTATLDLVSNQIRIRVATVNVPLTFTVPGVGSVTITTVPVSLPYSITLPINGIALSTDLTNVKITAYTQSLVRQYLTDRVRLTGDLSFR